MYRATLLIGVLALPFGAGATEPASVPGELLVRFRADADIARIGALHARTGSQVLEVIEELNLYRVKIPATRSLQDVAATYAADPGCAYAEPNYLGRGGDFVPNDSFLPNQWHLNNTGQSSGLPDADIDAIEGWSITRGSPDITVAVLDTGIDFSHTEFQGRTLAGFDFVNSDSDPTADHRHGSQVSGLLAANADNAFGIAGVDHAAKILPVKVLDANNLGSTANLIQGLVFAAQQGADVINMSLIGFPPFSLALSDALQFTRDAGSILIACAGNNGIGDADVSGPGASPLTLSVGWTTRQDTRALSSATGNALDLVAPGEDLVSIFLSPTIDGGFPFSGCSAATPLVSGIVSLMLSLDPSLDHDQVRAILIATAEDQVGPPSEDAPGWDPFLGHGRVNMDAALRVLAPPPVPLAPSWLLALFGVLLLRTGARRLRSARA